MSTGENSSGSINGIKPPPSRPAAVRVAARPPHSFIPQLPLRLFLREICPSISPMSRSLPSLFHCPSSVVRVVVFQSTSTRYNTTRSSITSSIPILSFADSPRRPSSLTKQQQQCRRNTNTNNRSPSRPLRWHIPRVETKETHLLTTTPTDTITRPWPRASGAPHSGNALARRIYVSLQFPDPARREKFLH